jgi:hypothetical protein
MLPLMPPCRAERQRHFSAIDDAFHYSLSLFYATLLAMPRLR